MLNLKQVLAAKPKPHKDAKLIPLETPWTKQVTPDNVLPEHPNPQLQRTRFTNLNGSWDYAFAAASSLAPYDAKTLKTAVLDAPRPAEFDGQILVPFSPEAPLSGVGKQLQPNQLLWYARTFDDPQASEEQRVILHFEAVDYVCACWVNGMLLGTHAGGYLPFSFDITHALIAGKNELLVCVADPSEKGVQLRGKQRLDRGDIWYTAQSGIWQTVWLEAVPTCHIGNISTRANVHNGMARVKLSLENPLPGQRVNVTITDQDGSIVASGMHTTKPGQDQVVIALSVPGFQLWSPENPQLYHVTATVGDDLVRSYFAFRTVTMQRDGKGYTRLFLNDAPVFLKGVLDQGYWPDGLMTAPSDEALVADLQAAKNLGFNMVRKHIKIESRRWYYHADRLGMLVWQDMVSGGDALSSWHSSYKPTLFQASWRSFDDRPAKHQQALSAGSSAYQNEWLETCRGTINLLKNHPSIITWVLFNEGWGQFDARSATAIATTEDPTRPIDAVSGWYDQGCGNFISEHNYFRPLESKAAPEDARAYVISEFGGLGWSVPGHCALDSEYGYANYQDAAAWEAEVRGTLAKVDALEKNGLAGYVYTQLTDVEEETNGLLTYDRLEKS